MKVIIAGTRTFNDYDLLCEECDRMLTDKVEYILSGLARGADELGQRYATDRGYKVLQFPPAWNLYGRKAGPMRNRLMAEEADGAIVFWDGKSRGTMNMIDEMKRLKKPCYVFRYDVPVTHPAPPTSEVQ